MSETRLRVALISPKGPLYRHRGGIFRKSLRYGPLTLTTLASLVPAELPIDLQIFDEGIEDVPLDLAADLVGMTVITGTSKRAYLLADQFRARGIQVVLGGPHVTLIPEDAAPHADAIVTGYAEDTWPRLLRDFAQGALQARYDMAPGLSLANRPFPRRELLQRSSYLTTNVFEATRGCVHACEFCVVPTAWGRTPFQKPVEDVVADIRQYRAKKLIFVNLNLIADRAYATRLFTALAPLKVQWYGLATSILLEDPDLLELMARSGCRGLLIGFESLDAGALSHSRKGFNQPARYRELVEMLHRHDIALQGCFVFGLDEDGPDVFDRTAEWCIEAGIDLPRFAVVTPFPGTPLFKRLEAEGRILTRDWEQYDGQHVVFRPKQMTVDDLQAGHLRAWRRTYSWRGIARRLAHSRVQLPLGIAANLGYRFYARNLSRFYNCDWMIGSAPAPRMAA